MSKPQTLFWFVHANYGAKGVCFAVAAFTERSARVQARKQLGPKGVITDVQPVPYAHAWPIDFMWRPPEAGSAPPPGGQP